MDQGFCQKMEECGNLPPARCGHNCTGQHGIFKYYKHECAGPSNHNFIMFNQPDKCYGQLIEYICFIAVGSYFTWLLITNLDCRLCKVC